MKEEQYISKKKRKEKRRKKKDASFGEGGCWNKQQQSASFLACDD